MEDRSNISNIGIDARPLRSRADCGLADGCSCRRRPPGQAVAILHYRWPAGDNLSKEYDGIPVDSGRPAEGQSHTTSLVGNERRAVDVMLHTTRRLDIAADGSRPPGAVHPAAAATPTVNYWRQLLLGRAGPFRRPGIIIGGPTGRSIHGHHVQRKIVSGG